MVEIILDDMDGNRLKEQDGSDCEPVRITDEEYQVLLDGAEKAGIPVEEHFIQVLSEHIQNITSEGQ